MLITSHVSKVNCSEKMELFFMTLGVENVQVNGKEGQREGSGQLLPSREQ